MAEKVGAPFVDERLSLPTKPPLTAYIVWDAFWSLNRARGSGQSGPQPITFQEILAWTKLYRQPLDVWEVNALRAMDEAYLEEVAALDRNDA